MALGTGLDATLCSVFALYWLFCYCKNNLSIQPINIITTNPHATQHRAVNNVRTARYASISALVHFRYIILASFDVSEGPIAESYGCPMDPSYKQLSSMDPSLGPALPKKTYPFGQVLATALAGPLAWLGRVEADWAIADALESSASYQ